MSWMRFFKRARWDAERARELEAHLQLEIDDNLARGLPPDRARTAAHRKLGNVTLIREEIYHVNTLRRLDTLWQDVRYGARLLRLNPGFAAVAILSLALGVGANTAIFQLVDAVRLRTLPVANPQEIAEVRIANTRGGRTGQFNGRHPTLTSPLWERIRDGQHVFSSIFAWSTASFDLATGGESRPAQGLWVSGDFFQTLDVSPILGRLITVADDRRGCGSPGVVLSAAFWEAEFGGNASALGRTLSLDGHPFEIVGVTAPAFFGVEVGRSFDVAVPICAEPIITGARSALDRPHVWWLTVMGRLAPGMSLDRASAEFASRSPGIFQATLPPTYTPADAKHYLQFSLGAFPAGAGVSDLRRAYETPLWLLLAIAGSVLLIACGNLANLMLARASAREREMALRLAIGASRRRLVRQLMVESLLVAVAGALLGTILAGGLSRFLVSLLSSKSDALFVDLHLDWRVLAFTAGTAMLTCVLFGLVPAMRATRTSPGAAMKSGGRGLTDNRERFGLRRALVVAQMALSLVLVVGALLFVRTLRNLVTLDPGFRKDGILIAGLDLRRANVPADREARFQADVLQRLRALPGVEAAAAVTVVPVSEGGWNDTLVLDGVIQKGYPNINRVGADYFKMMAIPFVAGRGFSERDSASAPQVAIVSESFVRTYIHGRDPIGSVFQFDRGPSEPHVVYQVIGVVKDTKYNDLREPFGPIIYFADTQETEPSSGFTAMLRSTRVDAGLTAGVIDVVRAANPRILVSFETLDGRIQASLVRERLMATLSGFFAGLAGLLAAIGLYGVMSYGVTRRRNEIGIRMALGANRAAVIGMVLREAALLTGLGLAVGVGAAVLAAQSAQTLLFELTPGDPLTLAASAAALAVVAACASALPAQRAAQLPPSIALRDQ